MKKYSLLLLLCFQGLCAQVTFEAKTEKTNYPANEAFRVEFVMNVAGNEFTPPAFEGFKILSGPTQKSSDTHLNGKTTFTRTYLYFLKAPKLGTFTIQPATLVYEGKTYSTKPIALTITKPIERTLSPNDTLAVDSNNIIHLIAEVAQKDIVAGDSVAVAFKLYFSPKIGIKSWKITDKPSYGGLTFREIDVEKVTPVDEQYRGEKFRSVILKRAIVKTDTAGKFTIADMVMELKAELPTTKKNQFGQTILASDIRKITVKPLTISVVPKKQ